MIAHQQPPGKKREYQKRKHQSCKDKALTGPPAAGLRLLKRRGWSGLSWGIGHSLGYHAGAEEGKLLQIGPAICALLILKLQLTSLGWPARASSIFWLEQAGLRQKHRQTSLK
jgi:hypothetical protein